MCKEKRWKPEGLRCIGYASLLPMMLSSIESSDLTTAPIVVVFKPIAATLPACAELRAMPHADAKSPADDAALMSVDTSSAVMNLSSVNVAMICTSGVRCSVVNLIVLLMRPARVQRLSG